MKEKGYVFMYNTKPLFHKPENKQTNKKQGEAGFGRSLFHIVHGNTKTGAGEMVGWQAIGLAATLMT